jgi:hypothetical protein
MAKKTVAVDPADGLVVGEVGPWAAEKHERLRKYIEASKGARAKLSKIGRAPAQFIEESFLEFER